MTNFWPTSNSLKSTSMYGGIMSAGHKYLTVLLMVFKEAPFLSPGDISSPMKTRGTSTFNKALEGALMKVTFNGASVPAFK